MITFQELKEAVSPNKSVFREGGNIENFNRQLKEIKSDVNPYAVIHHNGQVYYVTNARQVSGQNKADMKLNLHPLSPTKENLYFSLKNGTSPTDFQQYGGTSYHKDHPAVMRLVDHIHKKYAGIGENLPGSIALPLDRNNNEDNELLHKSVFGNDYGRKKKGLNNIHGIIQGKVELLQHPDGHYIISGHHMYNNGELPSNIQGEIVARKDTKSNNHGFSNIRTGVFPVGSRKITEYI